MVAQHKIHPFRNDLLRNRIVITELRAQVGFVDPLTIDINGSMSNLHLIARHRQYPLNEGLVPIPGIPEHYDIPSVNISEPVNEPIHEDSLLVEKPRLHAGTFDLDRLNYEDHDK